MCAQGEEAATQEAARQATDRRTAQGEAVRSCLEANAASGEAPLFGMISAARFLLFLGALFCLKVVCMHDKVQVSISS